MGALVIVTLYLSCSMLLLFMGGVYSYVKPAACCRGLIEFSEPAPCFLLPLQSAAPYGLVSAAKAGDSPKKLLSCGDNRGATAGGTLSPCQCDGDNNDGRAFHPHISVVVFSTRVETSSL